MNHGPGVMKNFAPTSTIRRSSSSELR